MIPTVDQLLAQVRGALVMADALDLPYVAICLDEARVALEGSDADEATLVALGADWLGDTCRTAEVHARLVR